MFIKDIKKGWFVHVIHDLYGGLLYFGEFKNEAEAIEYKEKNKNKWKYDSIEILELPFIEYDDKKIAIWEETFCKQP